MSTKGSFYIPRSVTLPGGFKVKVNQLIPSKIQEKHGQIYDAVWDVDKMEIDINKRLSHKRKWYVLSHEFIHIFNDWVHWLINQDIAQG